MASQVFDFKASKEQSQKKTAVEPEITYTTFASSSDTPSAEHPLLVLDDRAHALDHHMSGSFRTPAKGSAFKYVRNGEKMTCNIVRIDKRFVNLIGWIGDSHMYIRLSGYPVEDGYAVYRIRAVDSTGKTVLGSKNSFLQMAISRLLASDPPEDVDFDAEGGEEDESLQLTTIPNIVDFLECAGNVLPPNVRTWAYRNVALTRSQTISQEERRHAQRALSMMLQIQWKSSYFESVDPVEARRILDENLYGMENVKQRIIETIIQINRTHTLPAYGLLLAGPAGIGKSQVAYAVARILKLPWTSLDMSTIRDAEALTGSPRVYSNAKPGRIMEAFYEAGASNLVFIINELDKADANNSGGNPSDALLTLLDNLGYTDNYIECTIPTTGVYPIATANDKSKISAPLMSRFAVIDIPDYTPDEKKIIFSRFSLPRVLKRMGMKKEECVVTEEGVDVVIDLYAGESGARDLEQAAEHLAANALYQIETAHVPGVVFDGALTRKILTM